jgi:hypothetical protein
MPLPFLIAGAVGAALWGAKKGFDAKEDFSVAESYNTEAQEIYEKAHKELDDAREQTQEKLVELGRIKANVYQKSLIPFVETFKQIKNIDFKDKKIQEELQLFGVISETDMKSVQEASFHAADVLSAGTAALGAGGLAGFGAFGGASLLATASTGTAISGLSGAAATNATLAWFGGGSVLTGGAGMAGGMAVLGGIVAGPVLLIGGMVMASKAEAARADAYANLLKAKAAVEEMETAATAVRGIRKRVKEISKVLKRLDDPFRDLLYSLKDLVAHSTHYPSYSEEDKKGLMMSVLFAKTLKNLMETPVIDEEGAVTQASRRSLQEAQQVLTKIDGF